MILRSRSLCLFVLLAALYPVAVTANELPVTFNPEPSTSLPDNAGPPPPSFRGRVPARPTHVARSRGASTNVLRRLGITDTMAVLVDAYVQDGWESAVAVNPSDASNVLVAFEEGWDFDPDVPLGSLRTGVTGWASTVFPPGSGIYGGFPSQPWAQAGNAAGEFFASLIRPDLFPTDNSHTILARSTNGGSTFSTFFEMDRTVKQDRAMFDIDRTAAQGGTTGTYDGKVYLTFDDWGASGVAYNGSFLEVLEPNGTVSSEVQCSGTGATPYRGAQFQPVAGLSDGQIFMVSNSISGGGATVSATFHELTSGGAVRQWSKSTLSWQPAGQKLGASTHWGVNGHRIDERGFLEVDRSFGPRRDYLYFISNRNPNPTDPTQDQGDLYLSVSVNRGSNWTTARIPTPHGLTQFFPMMDVDSQGWIHVAFYQNESGFPDGGVLEASTVQVYYTVSRSGGQTWTPPVLVNEVDHLLNMENPPLPLSQFDYDLLGDYMQIRAVGSGAQTSAYVLWTGYDQYRADDGVGTKKQRVYATRVLAPVVPASTPGMMGVAAAVLAAAGIFTLRRRRRGSV